MNQTLAKAEEATRENKLSEAEILAESVLADEPTNAKALGLLGVIALKRQNSSLAADYFNRSLLADPDNYPVLKYLALIHLNGQEPKLAQPLLERLLAQNQNDFQVWALLSQLEKKLGNLKAAKESGEKSLLINPNQPSLKAWLDSLTPKDPAPAPKKVKATQLTFLALPGQDEEIDLLGAKLERSLAVKKVVSLKEDPYVAALNGRGALWLEGFSPKTPQWLSRLTPGTRPVILRLGPSDLAHNFQEWPLKVITGVIFETKALLDIFLAKGLKPQEGAILTVAPRLFTPKKKPQEKAKAPINQTAETDNPLPLENVEPKSEPAANPKPISLAFISQWTEPSLIMEIALAAKELDPKANLWSLRRPETIESAKLVDYLTVKNSLAGSILFANPSLTEAEFYAGRTHLLDVSTLAGGVATFQALTNGLRPLIRDGLGARELYPADYLWSNLGELRSELATWPAQDPAEWVQKFTSVETLVERVNSLL
ncbi:MAG: tetratricopeptide repeat protein [Deltaproteobacteria bacterium]|jgi:tetratricopeptide (TPR) repeat protein|nr:tetratricopeptide repeat protein [Deltaproteobacteria bacterium]